MLTSKNWQVYAFSLVVLAFVVDSIRWCSAQPANANVSGNLMVVTVIGTLAVLRNLTGIARLVRTGWENYQTRPSRKS